METSDSEYFESADEDFINDDETQIEVKKEVKTTGDNKLVKKAEKLSVSEQEVCDPISKSDAATTRKVDDNKTELCTEKDSPRKEPSAKVDAELNKTTPTTETPLQTKTECWEPFMDYNADDETPRKKSFERSEFGIPPARVGGCWLPNIELNKSIDATRQSKENLDQSNINNNIAKFNIPPAVSSSGLQEKIQEKQQIKINSVEKNGSLKNTNEKQKPSRPEFGIPPAIPTCWVPGVSNMQTAHPPFTPHPAYLELMKKQNIDVGEKNINEEKEHSDVKEDKLQEENLWNNDDDWGDFEETTHDFSTQKQSSHESKIISNEKDTNAEENMWEGDDWEPIESNPAAKNIEKLSEKQTQEETSSWGSWGNWGISTVISTATNLTSHVSQGISNVLETGIGAPDPEELAKINKMERDKVKNMTMQDDNTSPGLDKPILSFDLGNFVQGVTKLVETTSTKVISGGLDTLETIGKKTMEVLQENDPGLKKKRAFLKLDSDKPILSHVLRDAKEKAEQENRKLEKKHFARKANYEALFDDHQGLVHLEALEMLSKQCDIKLQTLLESTTGDALIEMQETLDQVKELCELPEEDEEETQIIDEIREKLEAAVAEINVNITYSRLLTTWQDIEDWLGKLNLKVCSTNELHQQAIESLAQLTAIAVEQFHKAGELLLIKEHRSTADEADSLVQLTTILTALIGIVAAKFSEKLNMIVSEDVNKEEVNSLITNVFFEAANSSSYIQEAFQLLIPVLQVGAV